MLSSARIFVSAFLFIILFPLAALAADASTTPAGFAATPVWLSSVSPVAGDALKLFTVVKNSGETAVSGTVIFLLDGESIGSAKASLAIGTAQIVSTDWRAVEGVHNITATFLETTAGPFVITVATAPPKPVALQYLDTAMAAVGDVALPTLSEVKKYAEGIRQGGEDYFAKQLAASEPQGQVLGAETENIASGTPLSIQSKNGLWSLFNQWGYKIFKDPMYFYPFIIIFGFFILWIFLRLFSRD